MNIKLFKYPINLLVCITALTIFSSSSKSLCGAISANSISALINTNNKELNKNTNDAINSSIEDEVRLMEYSISKIGNSYQSPNRKQQLKTTYTSNSFNIQPRVNGHHDFNATLKFIGIYDGNKSIINCNENAIAEKNKNQIRFNYQNNLIIDYLNTEFGVEQTFTVNKKPIGTTNKLQVKMSVSGNMKLNKINDDEINLTKINTATQQIDKIIYNKLKVWDANNTILAAKMDVENDEIILSVNTSNAAYPITIDPSTTFADWGLESNKANSNFGCSIFSAGDINGDGYSDILVGASTYNNTLVDEGAAFVYLGGPSGISNAPTWSYFGGQAGANFGASVCTAGDVNGDGYGDILIGAPKYDGEGKVFAFYGNNGGQYPAQSGLLTATPQWTLKCNQAGANFGISLAGIGDFNNDGYGDIIIGANKFDNGETDEGAAFIVKGQGPKPYLGPGGGLQNAYSYLLEKNQANANFGISVASAGDVNGDGFYDVIIGANLYTNTFTNQGAAFVWQGSSLTPALTPNWTGYATEADNTNDNFGCSVSTAGDLNGDGYSEVAVGCDKGDNPTANETPEFGALTDNGKAYVFAGQSSGLGLTPAVIKEGKVNSARFGTSVACGGDMNADGYAELIIGCPYYLEKPPTIGEQRGRFYVYEGDPIVANIFPYIIYTGAAIGDNAGYCAAPAGDVNGDGFSDVIFSTTTFTNGQTNEGKIFAIYGLARGLNIGGTRDVQLEKNQANASMGSSVASAGDINGDGFNDVIVGVPAFDNTFTDEGAAFLYLGSATGLSATSSWAAYGGKVNAKFGSCVSSAGDVNGDGYNDVLISAPQFDGVAGVKSGVVRVYTGAAAGLSTVPIWIKEGSAANSNFGSSAATLGDINIDGYSDIVIGAENYTGTSTIEAAEGGAFAFYGSSTGPSISADWQAEGNQANAHFGRSVAGAGDVNGDGYCDVIIGAPDFDQGFTDNGKAFVYNGSLTGINTATSWTFAGAKASAFFGNSVSCAGDVNADAFFDVAIGSYGYSPVAIPMGRFQIFHGKATGLNATANFTVDGVQNNAQFGFSVSSAGDVNGDGYSDVIVGANLFDKSNTDEGQTYAYYGSYTGLTTTNVWTAWGKNTSIPGMQFGTSVAAAGDVNGDGYGDVIVGAPIGTNGEAAEGLARVFYGNEKQNCRNNMWLLNTNYAKCIDRSNMGDNLYGIAYWGHSFMGVTQARAGWEVKKEGIPFSSYGVLPVSRYTGTSQRQNTFPVLGLLGSNLLNQSIKLYPAKYIKTRIRTLYPAVSAITGQLLGPWRYVATYHQGPMGLWSVVLPLKLLYFDAKTNQQDVVLNWTVANQKNNNFYTVQRSNDGIHYIDVKTITSDGLSNTDYSFSDKNILSKSAICYYRLKINDNNVETFSSVKKIELEIENIQINYQNAAINISSTNDYAYSVITSVGGIVVKGAEKKGIKIITLPSSIAQGIYFVIVKTNNGVEKSKKIIVQ
jgi:FG-GAP repeat